MSQWQRSMSGDTAGKDRRRAESAATFDIGGRMWSAGSTNSRAMWGRRAEMTPEKRDAQGLVALDAPETSRLHLEETQRSAHFPEALPGRLPVGWPV